MWKFSFSESPGSISNQDAGDGDVLHREEILPNHVMLLSLWECEHTEHTKPGTSSWSFSVVSVICVHLIQHSLCFCRRGVDSSSSTSLCKMLLQH